jgi:hypothetical protein
MRAVGTDPVIDADQVRQQLVKSRDVTAPTERTKVPADSRSTKPQDDEPASGDPLAGSRPPAPGDQRPKWTVAAPQPTPCTQTFWIPWMSPAMSRVETIIRRV